MQITGQHVYLKLHIERSLPHPGSATEIPLVGHLLQQVEDAPKVQSADATLVMLQLTEAIADAQFVVIRFTWNQYVESQLATKLVNLAHRYPDKYFIIWNAGDLEAIIPVRNAIQFENGLHRSVKRMPRFAFELPAFWPDYLQIYFNGQLQVRQKQERASVGFCGQATSASHKIAYFTAKNALHAIAHKVGQSPTVPPPVKPAVLLRNRALGLLSQSDCVDSNFIIRDQYRAGIRSKAERDNYFHPTKVEFVNNIIDNDYTVCVRGGGNFSVRLYETLSCGRIPIFIDTDSRLPFDFLINWKEYCIWVDQQDMYHLPQIVNDFHSNLSGEDFIALQRKCRDLWRQWLRKESFLAHFYEHLLHVVRNDSRLIERTVH